MEYAVGDLIFRYSTYILPIVINFGSPSMRFKSFHNSKDIDNI